MLIYKEVKIQIKAPTVNYFKTLGYNVKINDYITIPISQLKMNSHVIIDAKCDICGYEKQLNYSKYNKNISRYGFYTCGKKCAIIKSKKTNIEKLSVDNPMKSDAVKNKMITNSLKKNGTSYFVQTNNFKIKSKKTKKHKYGDENYNNRVQATETLLANYDKTILTNQERYGCNTPFQNKNVKQKIRTSKIKSGFQISDESLNAWQIYKRDVKNETYKFKRQLFNDWNGYDFYDGEYIRENFNLNHIDKLYPTIDHKISVHYGFLNNIPVETIGNINNLCVTKRSINSSKNNRQNFKI